MKDSLERLLYVSPPFGFPSDSMKISCQFEAGGAYETWGWVCEYNGKIIASHKYLDEFLKQVRFICEIMKIKPKEGK